MIRFSLRHECKDGGQSFVVETVTLEGKVKWPKRWNNNCYFHHPSIPHCFRCREKLPTTLDAALNVSVGEK